MSKKATICVNKTRSCASKLKYLFLHLPKKWAGRAMGNETFYGDGLVRSS